ncbi:TetR family transcriptional regulator [Williamsia sp.]|uniref:TetR/AcrR family transcriptional regulator n=1 Tax=Williamsia sp. TaxID=1872085 RepID=UPI001A2408B7|nr:TetR family transcriptional regulator [Williamsia sp.]MBJ7289016.1 TetR family transcriptional regulator [Williamsia sp.]
MTDPSPGDPTRNAARTRAALVSAAQRRFADDGFAGTTVRAVAADAGVDPALVMRYFGSKRGLYEAATAVDLHLPDFSSVARRRLGAVIVETFLSRWDGPEGEPLRILLASAATETTAAEQMRTIFAGQVRPAVAAAGGEPDVDIEVIASTLIGMAMMRYVLRVPDVVALTPTQIVERFGPALQRQLVRR